MTDNNKVTIALGMLGGLCNRMNAILSAIALIDRYRGGYKVDVYWGRHEECGAHFDELFQPIHCEGLSVNRVKSISVAHSRKRNLYLPDLVRKFVFDASFHCRDTRDKDFETMMRGKRKVFIYAYNNFCPYIIDRSLARYFRPVEAIERRIKETTDLFAPHTIGVHIRRTDHKDAIKDSPTELFLHRMDEEIARDGDCKFYIATDDEQLKHLIADRYGKRIITCDRELSRHTVSGMQDAVAELYCLGRTSEILGSAFSTYSIDAAALYDIPLHVLTTKNQSPRGA